MMLSEETEKFKNMFCSQFAALMVMAPQIKEFREGLKDDVGALIIRIGFWGFLMSIIERDRVPKYCKPK